MVSLIFVAAKLSVFGVGVCVRLFSVFLLGYLKCYESYALYILVEFDWPPSFPRRCEHAISIKTNHK